MVGEVVIDIASLSNGKPDEKDHSLTNPSKKKSAAGSIKLKLHFPMPESASPLAAPTTKKRTIQDMYTFGEELGR